MKKHRHRSIEGRLERSIDIEGRLEKRSIRSIERSIEKSLKRVSDAFPFFQSAFNLLPRKNPMLCFFNNKGSKMIPKYGSNGLYGGNRNEARSPMGPPCSSFGCLVLIHGALQQPYQGNCIQGTSTRRGGSLCAIMAKGEGNLWQELLPWGASQMEEPNGSQVVQSVGLVGYTHEVQRIGQHQGSDLMCNFAKPPIRRWNPRNFNHA